MDKTKCTKELPEKLAEMDIACTGLGTETRVLRERKPAPAEPPRKRRTHTAPRKRTAGLELERIYLDKNTKLSPRALETISEEGGCGGRKLRRQIRFAPGGRAAADKAKKRRQRIKKLLGDGFLCRNKLSMQAFLSKINAIESNPPVATAPPPPPSSLTPEVMSI